MNFKNKKMVGRIGALAFGAALLPMLVMAQSGIKGAVDPPSIAFDFDTVVDVLNTVVTWLFTIFLIVAVIFVILAAFKYLTSGGDPEKVKEASRNLVFAAVAIAVALLSISVRFLVQDFLGTKVF